MDYASCTSYLELLKKKRKEKKIKGFIPKTLFDKNWVIYAKQTFGGSKQVINYLGRYTHRTVVTTVKNR